MIFFPLTLSLKEFSVINLSCHYVLAGSTRVKYRNCGGSSLSPELRCYTGALENIVAMKSFVKHAHGMSYWLNIGTSVGAANQGICLCNAWCRIGHPRDQGSLDPTSTVD